MFKELQKSRLEVLKKRCEMMGIDLVKSLEGVLELGKSAVYRRMDASIQLTFEEIHRIQRHFQLPPDFFTQYSAPYVNFRFPTLTYQPNSIDQYIAPIRDQLNVLRQQPQPHIVYSSSEIPFFHYFHNPELAYFKFYLWGRMVWKIPSFLERAFDQDFIRDLDDQGIPDQLKQMLDIYQSIPSTEFWSVNILDNTINQIRFQYESRHIPDLKLARQLMNNLLQMVRLMERQANDGVKVGSDSPFTLHHNEITHTNNTILIESAGQPLGVFITYDNPNFMFTQDAGIAKYTQSWFHKLEEGSILIARTGARQRSKFFSELDHRWEDANARLV